MEPEIQTTSKCKTLFNVKEKFDEAWENVASLALPIVEMPPENFTVDVLNHAKFNSLVFLEHHLLRCKKHDVPAKLTHACVDCKSGQIEALETQAPCGCKYRHEITTEVL